MAANLDRLAELFRQSGYPVEADALKAQAAVFRRSGVREELPEDTGYSLKISESNIVEPLENKFILRRALEEAFSVPRDRYESRLTESLALRVNRKVGQRLPDNMRLEDLLLKGRIVYPSDIELGTQAAEIIIDRGRVTAFNEILHTFDRYGHSTVGDVRNIFAQGMPHHRIPGKNGGDFYPTLSQQHFIRTAFARPQYRQG